MFRFITDLFRDKELEDWCDTSNDGVIYTSKQWEDAETFVRNHLSRECEIVRYISRWVVTGAIAGETTTGRLFEYYMRDLVRGAVREDGYDEYADAVEKAGIVSGGFWHKGNR